MGVSMRLILPGWPTTRLPGGIIGALQDQRAGGYDAAFADGHAIQDDRAHADQAAVGDVAAVQRHGVTDGDIIAQDQRVFVAHHVQHRAVLNIRARADADVVHVAANHRARPDAGVFADDHVADDDGGGVDVGGCGDFGSFAAIGSDHAACTCFHEAF